MIKLAFNDVILASISLSIMMVLVLSIVAAHQSRALVMQWWFGWLLISLSLASYFLDAVLPLQQHLALWWVGLSVMSCLGMQLYVNGIRLLQEQPVSRYGSVWLCAVLCVGDGVLWYVAPMRWLVLANFMVLILLYAAGAKALMGRGQDFASHVLWLCSSLFAGVALMLTALWIEVLLIDASALTDWAHWQSHGYMLWLTLLALAAVTFLLVLIVQVRAQTGLQAMAIIDGLTGVFNRRGLLEEAVRMRAFFQRISKPMALLIVDLDHFKQVNDVYGHLVGDKVLRHCADTIRGTLRASDILGRYGGEEFCVLLPNTGEIEAATLAERIRMMIARTPINVSEVKGLRKQVGNIHCTVSIGAVSSETHGYNIETLFAAADHQLYQAKQLGRNRVETYAHALNHESAIPAAPSGSTDLLTS